MLIELIKSLFGVGVNKITVEELENKNIPVIDIRNENSYQNGHIPGAVNIPYSNFDLNHPQLKEIDKEEEIAVNCVSGISSIKITSILNKNGYKNAKSLKGGYQLWKSKNKG
ncbi:MAG: rhodanese-like domain-containing protein [Halanaerobium sp.]